MKKLLCTLLFAISLFHTSLLAQWVQQSVPVSKPITGIKFINANTGWACTENSGTPNRAYILYTSNGGTNWIIQDSVNNATYGAISIINSNTGYCGGYDFPSNSANLKKTTNGGLNWVLIPTPTNMGISDMQFLNVDSGWTTVGNVGADVRTTTNGGLNWIVRTSGILQQTQKIFFLNYNTGYCGAHTQLYKTTNAGLNWTLNDNYTDLVKAIFFIDNNTGWVALTGFSIRYTTNAGSNCSNQIPDPGGSGQNLEDIYFINNQTGWAGTSYSKVYKTTNAGVNWGYQIVTGGSSRISFSDSQNGWAGKSGVLGLYHTTNGGGIILQVQNISNITPYEFALYQNYPNPFNPRTNIKFSVSGSSSAQTFLSVFDILGREIEILVNETLKPGSYNVDWDATNYPSGVYFYKLSAGKFSETRKMVLIK